MKLFENIIHKKLELAEEHFLNRRYKRGFWDFYCVFNLSLALLGTSEDKAYQRIRNKNWRMFLLHDFNEKKYKKLHEFVRKDMVVIIDALKLIKSESEKMGYETSDLYIPFSVGVLSWEYPET